jgi:small ligand-binding sensory domain FIST
MRWASRVSENSSLEEAVRECCDHAKQALEGDSPDLAVAFVSGQHSAEYEFLPDLIKRNLGEVRLFGCSGGGVIGGGKEVENRAGFSLTVAHMPGVTVNGFHLESDELPNQDAGPDAWSKLVGVPTDEAPPFLLLADPYTFPASNFILGMDYAYPASVKVGGLASGGQGSNALYLANQVYFSGAIGLAFQGDITVETVVAQGCRPIGNAMNITGCRNNILTGLDGDPPMEVLQRLYQSLDERDQGLMRYSLFLGVLMDEFEDDPKHGDFLIRNLIGTDSKTGAIAIGEMLREGQRVQFHLRDATTSREDLAGVLGRYASEHTTALPQGALLFSCLGRGEHLYGQPDHDTSLFQEVLAPIPLGGFFCNGEIGPVGGTTFLHGYTSSFGLFRPRSV